VLRGLLGGAAALAGLGVAVILVTTGKVEWRLVALAGALSAALGFASDVLDGAAAALRIMFQGGATPTFREEADSLERRLGGAPSPEQEVLWGVRLAELYRRHLGEPARAAALLDRLLLKHPDSRELRYARGLMAGPGEPKGS
jgi:hypothetical protein